jgi:CheY-like chemotaxis protein
MPQARGALNGRKILVVEDNYLIAEHVRRLLLHEGCDIVGPAGRLPQALEIVRRAEALDGGVLDINLDGQLCFPVAAALAERSVPFVFLTGYDDPAIIPAEFAKRPVLSKPLDEARLIEVAAAMFTARGAAG